MVLDFYHLKQQPFGVTPDPRYLYPSPTHREALASLAYGIQSGRGFMSIVATPGMGKTTILHQLLQQLESSARIAFLCQTLCRPEEIMRGVLRDLDIAHEGTDVVSMEGQLNDLLLAEAGRGRKVVVVIDEAQNLDDSALEVVRLLSNFETSSDKLLQIILAGQHQLREKLASPRLLQLRQRMSIIARLEPFSAEETQLYIAHRLRVAGYGFSAPLFTPEAEALIATYSEGIPRNINNICFNALSLGRVLKQKTIQKDVIREVLDDLDLKASVLKEAARESVGRELFPSIASGRTALFNQPFVWRKRVAAGALLLLPLVFFGARRSNMPSSPSLATVIGAAQIKSESPAVAAARESFPGTARLKSAPRPLPSESYKSPEAVSPSHIQKSQQHRKSKLTNTSNLDQLWALVKQQNSNAEVELARMYLEGSVVHKNCQQARVLLLAASRKQNRRATDLLSNYGSQCADVPAPREDSHEQTF
jgi:general secretion pathway protein A